MQKSKEEEEYAQCKERLQGTSWQVLSIIFLLLIPNCICCSFVATTVDNNVIVAIAIFRQMWLNMNGCMCSLQELVVRKAPTLTCTTIPIMSTYWYCLYELMYLILSIWIDVLIRLEIRFDFVLIFINVKFTNHQIHDCLIFLLVYTISIVWYSLHKMI